MSWITENPWPLMLLLAGTALVMLILGERHLRTASWCGFVLAGGVYLVESLIVTSGEQLEETMQSMLDGFVAGDLHAIDAGISDQAPALKETARRGLALVELRRDFHLKDITVSVADDGQSASAELRANGMLVVRQSSTLARASTRWLTKWIRQQDHWTLLEVHRLNPVTGEEIGVLTAQ
jgi:hypothetical protein